MEMRTRRLLTVGLAMTGVTAGMLTTAAGPANAATKDCRPGEFCLFENSNGTGWILHLGGSNPTVERRLSRRGMNDSASAFWNRTGAHYCVFLHSELDGPWLRVEEGTISSSFDLASVPWLDNESSSVSQVGAHTSCDDLD